MITLIIIWNHFLFVTIIRMTIKNVWFKSRSKHFNQWKASLRDLVLNVKILDFSSSKIHRSNILLNSAQRKPLNRLSLGKLNVQVAFIQKHNISPFTFKENIFISLFMGMKSLQMKALILMGQFNKECLNVFLWNSSTFFLSHILVTI